MQDVGVSESREPFGHTYAEPLSGLRISWGAVLAGTVTIFAVSLILWGLGLAIVALATHADWSSVKGSIIALWIIAMIVTLVGCFVGGWVAGTLPGNPQKRIGVAHAFIAWGLAFVISSFLIWSTLGSTARLATEEGVNAATGIVQATGAAAGGAAGSNVPLSQRAVQTLTSLGYTPAQANKMVGRAQAGVQTAKPGAVAPAVSSAATSAGVTLIRLFIAIGWSWWGTWFVSMFLALAGGALGATRLGRLAQPKRPAEQRESERARPMGPLTPAPTA